MAYPIRDFSEEQQNYYLYLYTVINAFWRLDIRQIVSSHACALCVLPLLTALFRLSSLQRMSKRQNALMTV